MNNKLASLTQREQTLIRVAILCEIGQNERRAKQYGDENGELSRDNKELTDLREKLLKSKDVLIEDWCI